MLSELRRFGIHATRTSLNKIKNDFYWFSMNALVVNTVRTGSGWHAWRGSAKSGRATRAWMEESRPQVCHWDRYGRDVWGTGGSIGKGTSTILTGIIQRDIYFFFIILGCLLVKPRWSPHKCTVLTGTSPGCLLCFERVISKPVDRGSTFDSSIQYIQGNN